MLDEKGLMLALKRHWDYTGIDEDITHEIYHDDAVLEFPSPVSGAPERNAPQPPLPRDIAAISLLRAARNLNRVGCAASGSSDTSNWSFAKGSKIEALAGG